MYRAVFIIFLVMSAASPSGAQPQSQVINLLSTKASELETVERFSRKSESLPLTLDAIAKMTTAGIAKTSIVEMMRTRGVLALASPDNLIKMKQNGASEAMLTALSAYALKPNQDFNLEIILNLTSDTNFREAPFLYVEVWNPRKMRQEALLHADLRVKRVAGASVQIGRGDPLLNRNLKRTRFKTQVRSRGAGQLILRVMLGQEPGLLTLTNADGVALQTVQEFKFDYPAVSLERECSLGLVAHRDAMLHNRFDLTQSRLECRWD